MAKRRITPLAQALVLVDTLSIDEQTTLADYIKGKLPQAARRPKSAPNARKRSPPATIVTAKETATAVGGNGGAD